MNTIRRRIIFTTFFAIASLLIPMCISVATAAESTTKKEMTANPISVRAEASKGSVTVGEPVEYRVSVRYSSDVEILNGIGDPAITGLEVKSSKDWEDRDGKFKILGKTFTLSGFQLGNFLIEPLEISYRVKSGTPQVIKTNPAYITVKSVAEGEEKEDIRDVKGVVKLPYKIFKYLLWVGIPDLTIILLLIYFFYIRNREMNANRQTEKLTPAEQALRDLHELFESPMIREGRVKQYYLRFSEIQKVFLEKQFGIQAAEATTSEIARLMKRIPITDESRQHLIEILEVSDFAKFAKWVPTASDILSFNKQAELVIRELSAPSNPVTEPHAVS